MTTDTTNEVATEAALPSRLSPSRMSDFKKCPKSFHFKSVLRIATRPTEAQVKGTVVHAVFEKVFELPRDERTQHAALELVPGCIEEARSQDQYAELFASLDEERFAQDVRELVVSWFSMEDPTRFDPQACELWVNGEVDGMPLIGVIDRLDVVEQPDGTTRVFISDYKTGKVPKERYQDDAFFAMRIYALMQHQAGQPADRLRLIYVKEGTREAVLRQDITPEVLARTEREVASIITSIRKAHEANEWPTKTGPLCGWCDYKEICPEFAGRPAPVATRRISPW